ncbi:MAG TPA: lysine--tRNA ligase [Candidatus Paceibacterota bacterium]|nr:lysine--tRNA ligase [Candidatus Paceibacterota bacterium]
MFWADRIAKDIEATKEGTKRPLLIRDEKTLSGRVHIGSMRGVAIHGIVSEVLTEYGIDNRFLWEHNDFDPFDTVPAYLDRAAFEEHLGKPLYTVPSPEPGFENYAEYYADEFARVHQKAGFTPTYYRLYADLYATGDMDPYIRTALTHAADIRRIQKEVSGSVKDENWLPISVICERCGKMMTTRAYDFDGETVGYACDRSPDECVPCGYEGRVAPWKGAAKLFWKADWAAKWSALGVDIEGAGKDHSTRGGSRDVAKHIATEVFKRESPYDIPYEFFLVGGKKMSSSKGRGSSAKDMSDLFPPQLLRLVLLGKDINQQIDVDPEGDSIPRLYDWYDDLAESVRNGVADDFTRLYALCQLPAQRAELSAPWQMRFSQVAFIVQMPHLDLAAEASAAKGAPLTAEERALLEERAGYARFWLATYAPERYRYELQDSVPTGLALTDRQRDALRTLAGFFDTDRTGEEVHHRLHELKAEVPIEPKELFAALYRIFLNRDSGPKAGWFLSVLPREFVVNRLREASGT